MYWEEGAMQVAMPVVQRLAIGVISVVVVAILVFVGMRTWPGGVVQAILGQGPRRN